MNIHIGQLYASRHPMILQTLLGPCVAVCLYDSKNRIGGMNHIFLPGSSNTAQIESVTKYGKNAMESLIKMILDLGGDRNHFVAKAFGGAHVIPEISGEFWVGKKIAVFVEDFLKKVGITLVAKDLGGTYTRKVFFYTDSGNVFVKRILEH
jgi:chemotaxis protein CheD